ncbi:MAG: DUF421 domain-containing protein [Bdellovibrio sp.]|nr:DUF421 domain-containing protein [Bdellovibrio sp.]
MWQNFIKMDVSALNLVIRAVVVYFSVLILLRMGGKRQIGQMGPTEFVAVLLISNAVQNAMNAGDNSLVGGLILAATLVALSCLISFVTYKYKPFENFFEGKPTLLIHHGKMLSENMRKEQVSEAELHSLIRKQGLTHVYEVSTAILEADGNLTLIKADQAKRDLDKK